MSKTTVEVITSAYNEEDCLPELFSRLKKVFELEPNYEFKIIIMENASTDKTWQIISNEALSNSDIKAIKMSRNFSLDAAFTCGIDQAKADVAIIMTSDLQDPPEAIPELLRKYEEGYQQVLVKISSRKSVPIIRRILSKLFYKIANKLTGGMLPESVSDFRLLDRQTYSAVKTLRESHRFMRGLSSWVGFKTTHIEIERPPRFAGESEFMKISLLSAIARASRSILAYSATPLLWVSISGFILSTFSILGIVLMSIIWFTSGVPFAGFGTIVGLICLGFSLTMLCIGVLAQYLGLIYEEVKQRPLYIISEQIN